MRPVTNSFLQTVRGAHKAVFRARLLSPGLTGTNPGPLTGTGAPVNEVPILDGDVTFDTKADVNATLDLTTAIDWPAHFSNLASPYGNELFVERGVQYGNGTREYVGLGYFRIDSVEQEKTPNGALRISGSDRTANIRDGRATAPVQFGAGSSFAAVLEFVIGEVVPGLVVVYDFPATTTLLVSDHVLSQDRLKFCQELVAAYGKVMYFDYAGRLQVKNNPSSTTAPVWSVNHGRDGVLVSMKRAISRDGVYNGVVASGEAAGELPPVQAAVLDLDPLSPMYWNGPFGKVPRFFSSSFLTTYDQCVTAASSILAAAHGVPYAVTLGTVPNPAIEGWDVLAVDYSDPSDIENHIVDRISYSLSVDGPMGIDTRKQFLN